MPLHLAALTTLRTSHLSGWAAASEYLLLCKQVWQLLFPSVCCRRHIVQAGWPCATKPLQSRDGIQAVASQPLGGRVCPARRHLSIMKLAVSSASRFASPKACLPLAEWQGSSPTAQHHARPAERSKPAIPERQGSSPMARQIDRPAERSDPAAALPSRQSVEAAVMPSKQSIDATSAAGGPHLSPAVLALR